MYVCVLEIYIKLFTKQSFAQDQIYEIPSENRTHSLNCQLLCHSEKYKVIYET